MVKMVKLEKSAADKRADNDAAGSPKIIDVPDEHSGVTVNLDHHHLMKMGVGGGLKAGHKVEFSGRGTVLRSESRSTDQGERHTATLHMTHGGMEADGPKDEDREGLRSEITKLAEKGSDGDKAKGKGKIGKG
jgi:hypothetical protein